MIRGRVVIAGGTGFLGQALIHALRARGHAITVLSRAVRGGAGSDRAVAWIPDGGVGPWAAEIDGADAVVNLAGAGLADKRWSAARKQELFDSRVLSTRSLASAVAAAARPPRVVIQGSASGFYGQSETAVFTEDAPAGSDFLAAMAQAWEREAQPIADRGVRLVIVRTGVVLAKHGGALAQMIPPFRFFVGGPIASGRQYFSWIHLDDWIALMLWSLDQDAVSGPINATAPAPVTNAEFSAALGRALGRPSWARVPAFALRLIVGEMADHALIGGQRVVPSRPLALGFTFRYPEIDAAMRAAVQRHAA